MLDFPTNPSVGDYFPDYADAFAVGRWWQWDGEKWIDAGVLKSGVPIIPHHGRLIYEDPTHLRFVPHNGNRIKHLFEIVTIPDAGWVLEQLSVFRNDIVLVNLNYHAAEGFRLLATRAINSSHGRDTTPGNVGVEVIFDTMGQPSSGNTLVGMAYIDGNGEFVDTPEQRHVASWFNREDKTLAVSTSYAFVGNLTTTPTISAVPGATISTLCWEDGPIHLIAGAISSGSATQINAQLVYDNNVNNLFGVGQLASGISNFSFGGFEALTEGLHTIGTRGHIVSGAQPASLVSAPQGWVRL